MDIHKPKPWHGLREFLKEYLIIVVGVLTALAAEAVVQELDWGRRVREAEAAMRSELADNTRFAFERLASSNCDIEEISARRAALVKNRDEGAPVPSQPLLVLGNRLWSMDAWENARALQLTGHIPAERMRVYSRAYTHTVNFRGEQLRMRADRSDVNTLAYNAGRITPAERDRLFAGLQRLEDGSHELDGQAIRVLEAAKRLGVEVSPADRKMILESLAKRRTPASCVVDPSNRIANPRSRYDWFMPPDVPRQGS